MIAQSLLEILVCPETKQPLRVATADETQRLNRSIQSGQTKNRGGEVVPEPYDGYLVREDSTVAYGVRKDIPILLVEEALPIT